MDETQPSTSPKTAFIIIIIILILLIIGLIIWIIFLIHDKINSNTTPNCTQCASLNCLPNCTQCIQGGCCTGCTGSTGSSGPAAMPFYLYGFSASTTDFNLTSSLGVISQTGGALQVQPAVQDNTLQQWYIIPTSDITAVIQNVNSQQYIQGNIATNTLSMITGIQSATQFAVQFETQSGPISGGTGVANGVSFNGNPSGTAYYINVSNGETSVIFFPDSNVQSNDTWVMLPAISDIY